MILPNTFEMQYLQRDRNIFIVDYDSDGCKLVFELKYANIIS